MVKETARDYIVDAFRFYSVLKRPNAASARKKADSYLLNWEGSGHFGPEDASPLISLETLKTNLDAELADVQAVENTLRILRARPEGREILRAIETVYFFSPHSPQAKRDITDRVRCASLEIPVSERTIYYYLSLARKIFAQQRGLRTEQKKNTIGLADILSKKHSKKR